MSATGGIKGLFWTSRIRTDQLKNDGSEIKTVFEQVGESAKKWGVVGSQGIVIYTDNIKKAITLQKQLVSELGTDVKNLKTVYEQTAGYKQKLEAKADYNSANKVLIEEKGKLLALQREAVELDGKEKGTKESLVGSVGKWVIGLAAAAASLETVKKIIESTETTAHTFEQGITAAGSAMHYLFQTIASGDWSNFLDGLDRAVQGATDYVDKMEEIHNMQNQDKIITAEADKKIAELREKTYDRSKENRDERKEALTEIITVTEAKFDALLGTATKLRDTVLEKASTDTGGKVTADEIQNFIKEYRSLEEMLQMGKEYNQLKSKADSYATQMRNSPMSSNLYMPKYNEAVAELEHMGKAGEIAGKKVADIGKIAFSVRNEAADAMAAVVQLEARKEQGNKFDKRQLGTIETQERKDAEEAAKNTLEEKQRILRLELEYNDEATRLKISSTVENAKRLLDTEKDSFDKQRKLADINYQKDLIDIDTQRAAILEKYNKKIGGIDKAGNRVDAKYKIDLPQEEQAVFNQNTEAAAAIHAAVLVAIDEKEKLELKKIEDEMTDYRLSGMEKEKAAVRAKYDKLVQMAKGNKELIEFIEKKRATDNTSIDLKYKIKEVDQAEELAYRKNAVEAKGLNRTAELEKKNFNTFKTFTTQKIALLRQSNLAEDKDKADLLQGDLDAAIADKKAKKQSEIAEYAKQYTDQLIQQLDLGEKQTKQLMQTTSLIMSVAKGDYIAAGFQFLSMVTEGLIKKKHEFNEYYDEVNKKITDLIDSLSLVNTTMANVGKGGSVGAFNVLSSQILKLKNDADKLAESLSNVGTGSTTGNGLGSGGRRRGDGTVETTTTERTEHERTRAVVSLISQAEELRSQIIVLSDKLLDPLLTVAQQTAIKDILSGYNSILGEIDNVVSGITGTTTTELASAFADAFTSGENAATAWGNKVDEIIKKVIVNQLTTKLLTSPLTAAINALVTDTEGGLTTDEAKKFKETINNLFKEVSPVFQTAMDGMKEAGFNLSGTSQMVGAIKGMTEDQANLLAGQFTAMRYDLKNIGGTLTESNGFIFTSMGYLREIRDNTNFNKALPEILNGIKDNNSLIKQAWLN